MEIIDELEPTARGPYAGAVGYVDFCGNVDTAIALRTLVIADGKAWVQAGAGIVADSDPATEYQECLNKAAAALAAVAGAAALSDERAWIVTTRRPSHGDVTGEYLALRTAAGVVDGAHEIVWVRGARHGEVPRRSAQPSDRADGGRRGRAHAAAVAARETAGNRVAAAGRGRGRDRRRCRPGRASWPVT